jgi:hypothetical protein
MSEEGFLSRWSRRKRAIEAGRPVAEPEVAATPDALPPAPPPVPEEPPFDITTLPPIDSLTAASDFTAFLRKEVPAALRGAALRRAWSLDPAIRDFVGPADYAWDYNAPDGVPGGSLDLVGDVREMLAQVFGPEPAAEGDVQGKVAGVAPEGARDEGAPEGARDEGAPEGARDEGAPEGARDEGAPEGARDEGAPEGVWANPAPQGGGPETAARDMVPDSAVAEDSPPAVLPDAATMLPPALLAEAPVPASEPDATPVAPLSRRHGSALPS